MSEPTHGLAILALAISRREGFGFGMRALGCQDKNTRLAALIDAN
jgi:hypothetical protein